MGKALAAERVRRDVEVLARAGLDFESFVEESMASLSRAIPFDAVCVGTMDPSSGLLTGTHKLGSLRGVDEHDHEWGLIEYDTPEPTAFAGLAGQGVRAAGIQAGTVAAPSSSPRLSQFMTPRFGFTDELRTICIDDRGQGWVGIAMFRSGKGGGFDADEVSYLASLSNSFALGVRSGLLAGAAVAQPTVDLGPLVMIVDATGQVASSSLGTQERLVALAGGTSITAVSGLIGSLVGAARRYARGETKMAPRARIRAAGGVWLVLHAAPMVGPDGAVGDVVVTIEEARPPEIVPLVVATFGLTARERDITQLVLQGLDTKDIAGQLYLSSYTVQDHLKSVFEKAGVRSRRELIARVYFDQYVPRMDTALDSSGWLPA
ncbi:MAG: helix-turn-helix transcriptional regulator [Propionicimonas sp.]|uniref:helix-turn-helix transcriptional regulator n=1 Tax=Propionicimonas sp. TaxID=1955623 RepID=UPI002B21F48F|nr:helix-turn-helix transcriptional regulator [Propionicimonas sp.]MEA4944843.1 helix-turn-helix transcriptional regulator [Propionicimonas sp.]MEA5055245.1 helix-turn-helix transcriptional regulator [Propionicimonas sp.]